MRYLLTSLFLLPCIVMAQQLHTFKNGEVADAEKINENFGMATQKLYSGDSYVGRIIPWHNDGVLTVNSQNYFMRMALYSGSAHLDWSGTGTAYQSIYFTRDDCYGLGYIASRSIHPEPSLYSGIAGHVYSREIVPEFLSPNPQDRKAIIYISYDQPLEPSVLPENLYFRNYLGECNSESPLTDMILYEEKGNDPAITGYSFGLELPDPKIDIGL